MARGQSSFAHLLVEWGILAHKQRSTSLWRQPRGGKILGEAVIFNDDKAKAFIFKHTWKTKCPILKAIVAGFRGKVA